MSTPAVASWPFKTIATRTSPCSSWIAKLSIGDPAPVLAEPLSLGTPLALIGHPHGIPMKIDSGGILTSIEEPWLKATVDAFDGNSGSGVFDHQGRVRAILTNGEDDYVARGDCQVVNVLQSPADDGETLFPIEPVLGAFCEAPGVDSELCECDGPCVDYLPGDTCELAEPIDAVDQEIRATLQGYVPSGYGSCGGVGPDRAYRFSVASDTRLLAAVDGFDTVLYLLRECGEEVACNDDRGDSDLDSQIDAALTPGNYTLVVDAYDEDIDSFTLNLEFREGGAALSDAAVASDGGIDAGTDSPHEDSGCSASAAANPRPLWLPSSVAYATGLVAAPLTSQSSPAVFDEGRHSRRPRAASGRLPPHDPTWRSYEEAAVCAMRAKVAAHHASVP